MNDVEIGADQILIISHQLFGHAILLSHLPLTSSPLTLGCLKPLEQRLVFLERFVPVPLDTTFPRLH